MCVPVGICFNICRFRVCMCVGGLALSVRENLAVYKIGSAGWLLIFSQPALWLHTETIVQITLNSVTITPTPLSLFPVPHAELCFSSQP